MTAMQHTFAQLVQRAIERQELTALDAAELMLSYGVRPSDACKVIERAQRQHVVAQ